MKKSWNKRKKIFIAINLLVFGIAAAAFIFFGDKTYNHKVKTVTLTVKHGYFKEFAETQSVGINEPSYIHDTDYIFVVTEFLPDFRIKKGSDEIYSRSDKPDNPAVKIELFLNDKKQDEGWYYMNRKDYVTLVKPGLYFTVDSIVYGDKKYE